MDGQGQLDRMGRAKKTAHVCLKLIFFFFFFYLKHPSKVTCKNIILNTPKIFLQVIYNI